MNFYNIFCCDTNKRLFILLVIIFFELSAQVCRSETFEKAITVNGKGGNDRIIVSGDTDCFIQYRCEESYDPEGPGLVVTVTETVTEDVLEQNFHLGIEGGVLYTNAGIRSLESGAYCPLREFDASDLLYGFMITFNGFEHTYFYGETSDYANLYDTSDNDYFVTAGTYSYMAGEDGTFRLADGVPVVYGYSINGGTDSAWHYDTVSENETFFSSGTDYTLMAGEGYYNVAIGFPVSYSYLSG